MIPVYPRGDEILGQPAFRRMVDVPGTVDLVCVLRRSEHLSTVADDAIAAGAVTMCFQLGCVDPGAARRASEVGLDVVMDRCLMVGHARLLGRIDRPVTKIGSRGDTAGGGDPFRGRKGPSR